MYMYEYYHNPVLLKEKRAIVNHRRISKTILNLFHNHKYSLFDYALCFWMHYCSHIIISISDLKILSFSTPVSLFLDAFSFCMMQKKICQCDLSNNRVSSIYFPYYTNEVPPWQRSVWTRHTFYYLNKATLYTYT